MDVVNNMLANKREKITKQIPVECVVNLDGELDKVLSACANAEVTSTELYEKELKLNGEILVSVIYKTVDDQINNVTSNCSFVDVVKNDNIMPEQKVFANAKVVTLSPTSAENNVVKFVVTIEVEIDLAENSKAETLTDYDETICVKTDEIDINKLCGLNCADFTVESNSVLSEKVKKVLSLDSSVIVNETTVGEGFVSVKGMVCTYLVVLTEENKFKPLQICTEFKEEMQFEDLTSNDFSEVYAKVKKDAVKVVLEENENQINLNVSTPVKLCVRGYKTNKLEYATDVYSTKCELELEKQKYENVCFYKSKYFESKIEGSLVLSEEEPRIDKVLASTAPYLTITNSYFADGQVFVEGLVNTSVIYLNDQDEQIHSVEMEVPFKVSEKISLDNDVAKVDVYAVVSDCDCIAKRGREIFFDCKMKAYAQFYTTCNYEILKSVKEGRVYPKNDSAIEIYFAKKGDSVWDIAKELKITEEQLLTQNPDLVFPLENDEKIVLYYGVN